MNELDLAWQKYRELCDRPNVLTRWLLEQTLVLLRNAQAEALGDSLEEILEQQQPHDKPADHMGDNRVDTFSVNLSAQAVAQICRVIERAQAKGLVGRAVNDRELSGFIEAWHEYAEFLKHGSNKQQENEVL